MKIENKKERLKILETYLSKTKIWLENSDKNKALYGTRAEVREWTAKMKNAIEDCQNFYEQNEDYKKILLSVGNNTEEALREAHEFPRFEAEMGKVTRSISREIKNLTCEIICLENQQNGNEISLFMRPTHYAPHYQGRNVEKFVILDVTPNNVKGYEFTSDTQNVHDTIEIIEFNEHLSITTYRPQS